HGCGGGFPMTAGHGDSVLQSHQLSKQFAARDHWDLHAAGFLDFGILFVDGGTDDQRPGPSDVCSSVAFIYTGAHGGEALGDRRQFEVRAADLVTQVNQHLRYTAHPDSTYPSEMEMLGTKKHLVFLLFRVMSQVSMKNSKSLRYFNSSRP